MQAPLAVSACYAGRYGSSRCIGELGGGITFVIDVFALRSVGCKAASAPNTALVLDAWSKRSAVGCRAAMRRLLEPIGYVPPTEAKIMYYQQGNESAIAA